jgi:hypothetical protein
MFGTPEYSAWNSMLRRCSDPNNKDYGGRGISVCEEWKTFPAFFADMGLRPSARHSIDRINNNEGYSPGNCRWALPKEQARNKRNCHVLTVGNESYTLAEWAERTGIGKTTIRERIKRGWCAERAVGTPVPS